MSSVKTAAAPVAVASDPTATATAEARMPGDPRAIRKVGVLGSGVMGAGIAAHVANAGVPVVLLDIVPAGATDRNALAAGALARMQKTKPAPLMSARAAKLITPGNFDDDLGMLAECDWIVEAVLERADVKQDVYRRVDAVRKPGSIVSSNTSTIPLAKLLDGLPESFARDFLVTHFFNPPRYMRLLEVVAGPATRPDAVETVRAFADVRLGKSVVACKDTPAFIANRIGTFWIEVATREAIDLGLTVEEADAVAGRFVGFPKTGIFGLLDLVGIDLGPHIAASLLSTLPPGDPYRDVHRAEPLLAGMIERGLTGRKGKGGFYRVDGKGPSRSMQAIDLATGEYRPTREARLASLEAAKSAAKESAAKESAARESAAKGSAAKGGAALRALVEHADRGGQFAWRMLSQTLAYAASLVPAIADEIASVDEAMKTGYSWEMGPFELIDRLGPAYLAARLEREGRAVPPLLRAAGERTFYRVEGGRLQQLAPAGGYVDVRRPEGVLLLADVKRAAGAPVARNQSASYWDLGDGVLCLEFHTKMNSLDDGVVQMLARAQEMVDGTRFRALVIYNEATNFSVGANIGVVLYAANLAMWDAIGATIRDGQRVFRALGRAPFPVVAAPHGMALGGGCEVVLACAAVQAHSELYMGLVEAGVGVVPGWGGIREMLERWSTHPKRPGGPTPPVAKAFELISTAYVSTSAEEAREALFLRPNDGVTMNRDRLLADAKARALAMAAAGYEPPEEVPLRLPGRSARAALEMAVDGFVQSGKATPHDAVVARRLAVAVTGGDEADVTVPMGEEALDELAAEAFLDLVKTEGTLARIEHMLATGKPLRN